MNIQNPKCKFHSNIQVGLFCIQNDCRNFPWACSTCVIEYHEGCRFAKKKIDSIFEEIDQFLQQIRNAHIEILENTLGEKKLLTRTLPLNYSQKQDAEMCSRYIQELIKICKCCRQVADQEINKNEFTRSENAAKILKSILQNEMSQQQVLFDFSQFVKDLIKLFDNQELQQFIRMCQSRNKSGMLGMALNILFQAIKTNDPQELENYKKLQNPLTLSQELSDPGSFVGENDNQNQQNFFLPMRKVISQEAESDIQQQQYKKQQNIEYQQIPASKPEPTYFAQLPQRQENHQILEQRQTNQVIRPQWQTADSLQRQIVQPVQANVHQVTQEQNQYFLQLQQIPPGIQEERKIQGPQIQFGFNPFIQIKESEVTVDNFRIESQDIANCFLNRQIIIDSPKPISDFIIIDDKLLSYISGKTIQVVNYERVDAYTIKSFPQESDMKHQFKFKDYLFNLSKTEIFIINIKNLDSPPQKIKLFDMENIFVGQGTCPVVCEIDNTSFLLYLTSAKKIYMKKIILDNTFRISLDVKAEKDFEIVRCCLGCAIKKSDVKRAIFGDMEGQLLDMDQQGNLTNWDPQPEGEEIRSLMYFKDEIIISLAFDKILFWKDRHVIRTFEDQSHLDYLCFLNSTSIFAVFYDKKIEIWGENGKRNVIETNLNTNRARKYKKNIFVLTEGKKPQIMKF